MLIGLNSDLHKKVFDGQGLLGPIASKIDMAKALGLIDTGMHKNAKLIARVRNRFAHNLEIDSFSHPEVTKLVQKMEYPMVSQPDTLVNTIKVIESARAPATRVRFEVITIVFCYGLYLELPRVQSIMAQHRPKN
jgi:hypothetical protein